MLDGCGLQRDMPPTHVGADANERTPGREGGRPTYPRAAVGGSNPPQVPGGIFRTHQVRSQFRLELNSEDSPCALSGCQGKLVSLSMWCLQLACRREDQAVWERSPPSRATWARQHCFGS